MNAPEGFSYRGGWLYAEDVPLSEIAARMGTPVYVYASTTIERRYQSLAEAWAPLFAQNGGGICYAVKANPSQAVITTLSRLGAGADVVSEGELHRALAGGVPASRIVFSGVGKTTTELATALALGIDQINIESLAELDMLGGIAVEMGKTAPVVLRVNPNVEADTHAKIATGSARTKFGIRLGDIPQAWTQALAHPGLRPLGLAIHVGSQLTSAEPFAAAFACLAELTRSLRVSGHEVLRLDLGGGLGVPYHDDTVLLSPKDYAAVAARHVGDLGCRLTIEPGRFLVAEAGVLLTRVIRLKENGDRRFVIVDGAMNDLIRPSLYGAWHPILPVRQGFAGEGTSPVDIVGPVCETGDHLALQRPMPPLVPDDLLAVALAGAYGASMASSYNSRPLVPEVMVSGLRESLVRPRPTWQDLVNADRLPSWLEPSQTRAMGAGTHPTSRETE